MLHEDLIEVSKSGFNLPILIVRKKSGCLRLVTDSRCIGKYITKIRLPLPCINSLIRKLNTARMFCVIDLKEAFFQILLDEKSRHLTCFRTSTEAYQFKRTPIVCLFVYLEQRVYYIVNILLSPMHRQLLQDKNPRQALGA